MKKTVAIILLMIILFSMITNVVSAEPGTINTTTVRMRREANTSSDVLQLVGLGTEVEVLGEENGWYRVEYNGLTGYISSEYIDVEGDVSSSNDETPNATNSEDISDTSGSGEIVENTTDTNEPETSNNDSNNSENTETPNTTDTNVGDEVISETSEATEFVLTNDANLRTIPSFTSNRISTISQGTTVSVLDTLNRWVKITDGTNSGWVIRQNVEEVTSTGDASTTTTTDDSEVTVAMVDNGETSSQSSSNTAFPSNGTVNTDGSRLRDSADGKVYTLLDLNTTLEIVGEENDWYIVNVGEYTDAYISKSLVTIN